jgi:hypothetical protein
MAPVPEELTEEETAAKRLRIETMNAVSDGCVMVWARRVTDTPVFSANWSLAQISGATTPETDKDGPHKGPLGDFAGQTRGN